MKNDTEENRNLLFYYINTKFGERTVYERFVSEPAIAGNLIEMMYSTKWKKLKDGLTADISLTEYETYNKEVKTSEIFGYDGNGTLDDKITTEHTGNDEIDDIFGNMTKSFDFYNQFSYYECVARDIVHEITTYVFE